MNNNLNSYNTFNTINDINLELPNTLKFHWNLLFMCNYHCSFCYAREQEWNRLLKPDKIDSVINFLSKVKREFQIFLLGGEVSIYPYLDIVLDKLNSLNELKLNKKISIISNGAKLIKPELCNKFNNIHLSYYANYAKPDDFIKSIEYYKQYNYVLVTFLFDSNYQIEHLEILKYCKEKKITCYGSFIFHKDQIKKIDTSSEYFKLIEPYLIKNLVYNNNKFNEIEAYNQNLHYFKNWNCDNKTFDIPLDFNGTVNQFCSDIEYNIDMLNNNDFTYKCELEQCVCPARNNCSKHREYRSI